MTRQEEIKDAALDYVSRTPMLTMEQQQAYNAFKAGVAWAEKQRVLQDKVIINAVMNLFRCNKVKTSTPNCEVWDMILGKEVNHG